MKVLFFSKSKEINDVDVLFNILFVVLLVVICSYAFEDYVVDYLYNLVAPMVPGVDAASNSTVHVKKAKSFWSLSWFVFPAVASWVVFLSFFVRVKLKIKIRYSFYLLFFLLCIFAACYLGFNINKEDNVRPLDPFYYNSLAGVYLMSGSCWFSIFWSIFLSLRGILSNTRWTR